MRIHKVWNLSDGHQERLWWARCQVHHHNNVIFTACDSFRFVQLLQSCSWPRRHTFKWNGLQDGFCADQDACVLKKAALGAELPNLLIHRMAAPSAVCPGKGGFSLPFATSFTPFYSFTYRFFWAVKGKPSIMHFQTKLVVSETWTCFFVVFFFFHFRPRGVDWANSLEHAADSQSETYNKHSCQNVYWHNKQQNTCKIVRKKNISEIRLFPPKFRNFPTRSQWR